MKTKAAPAILALLLAAPLPGRAAIVVSALGSGTPVLEITADIVFTITTTGNAQFLVFDEWTQSDGGATTLDDRSGHDFAYVQNGNAGTVDLTAVVDNRVNPLGVITANDGYLSFAAIAVTAGDTLTVKAGTYTFRDHSTFNPALNGATFSGESFLTTTSGSRLTGNTLVPEPSALLLGTLGSLFLLRRKR